MANKKEVKELKGKVTDIVFNQKKGWSEELEKEIGAAFDRVIEEYSDTLKKLGEDDCPRCLKEEQLSL